MSGSGAFIGIGIASSIRLAGVLLAALAAAGCDGEPPTEESARPPLIDTPEPQDQGRLLIAEAERRVNVGNVEGATEAFLQALAYFRDRGDELGEADVFLGRARMEHFTGRSGEARSNFAQALAIVRRAGTAVEQAKVLVAMGDLEMGTFNWEPAAGYFREARALWAAAPDTKSDPHVLLNLETAPTMPAGPEQAWSVLQQAELIFRTIGDNESLAEVHFRSGDLHWNLGELLEAREQYRRATNLFEVLGQPGRQAIAALEVAKADIWEGLNLSASATIDGAAALLAAENHTAGMARANELRGDLERLQGRIGAALDAYADSASAFETLSHDGLPRVQLKKGQVELFLGDHGAALRDYEEAARGFQRSDLVDGLAATSLELGLLAGLEGRPAEATALLEAAANLFTELGDGRNEARALLALGGVHAGQGDPASARVLHLNSLRRFLESEVAFGAVLANLGVGDLESALGNREAAATAYSASVTTFAGMGEPLVGANRFLGLPPVGTLRVWDGGEDDFVDAAGGDFRAAEAAARDRVANLARYSDHSPEARALLERTIGRLAAATGCCAE